MGPPGGGLGLAGVSPGAGRGLNWRCGWPPLTLARVCLARKRRGATAGGHGGPRRRLCSQVAVSQAVLLWGLLQPTEPEGGPVRLFAEGARPCHGGGGGGGGCARSSRERQLPFAAETCPHGECASGPDGGDATVTVGGYVVGDPGSAFGALRLLCEMRSAPYVRKSLRSVETLISYFYSYSVVRYVLPSLDPMPGLGCGMVVLSVGSPCRSG